MGVSMVPTLLFLSAAQWIQKGTQLETYSHFILPNLQRSTQV